MILCKRRAFSRSEFERRERASIDGTAVSIATAEDTIIAKLEWAKLRDVRGILELRSDGLDRAYIETWVRELGLQEQWRADRSDTD